MDTKLLDKAKFLGEIARVITLVADANDVVIEGWDDDIVSADSPNIHGVYWRVADSVLGVWTSADDDRDLTVSVFKGAE